MTNTERLQTLIKARGFKKRYLAEQVGLSPQGFYNCLTNKSEFRVSQVQKLCDILGITDHEEKEAIFFDRAGA